MGIDISATHSSSPNIASVRSNSTSHFASTVLRRVANRKHTTCTFSNCRAHSETATPPATQPNNNRFVFSHATPSNATPSLHVLDDYKNEEHILVLAQLRLLANVAADRAEMHSILAQQRDNWNKLFQNTLTAATLTASLLAGFNGHHPSLSLSLPALLLDVGCAFMMTVINQFQPSQLAEEQRAATKLFKKLVNDIDYALQVPPYLRQPARRLLKDSKRRLHALDRAYPMPLTPGGLEKFPSSVVPPVLSDPPSSANSAPELVATEGNGWNESIAKDLKEIAIQINESHVKTFTSWAQNVVKVNKCLAIAAPLFAISGAVLNAASALGWSSNNILSLYAALCSVLAGFAGSFSHDMQLGMVFELYRNTAGYFADVEASINRTLQVPVNQRETGVLFRRRITYAVGDIEEEDGHTKN